MPCLESHPQQMVDQKRREKNPLLLLQLVQFDGATHTSESLGGFGLDSSQSHIIHWLLACPVPFFMFIIFEKAFLVSHFDQNTLLGLHVLGS